MPDEADDLVREQIAYYRAFAPEWRPFFYVGRAVPGRRDAGS